MFVIWGATYTVMDIPYWAMLPSLAFTEKERNGISSVARVCLGIGGLIVVVAAPFFVDRLFGMTNPRGYLVAAVIVSAAFFALMAATAVLIREKYSIPVSRAKLRDIFKIFGKNKQLRWYMLFVVLIHTAMMITTTFAVYFFTYDLRNFALSGVFAAVAGLGYGVGMAAYSLVCKKLGARKTFLFSVAAVGIGYLLMFAATAALYDSLAYDPYGIPIFRMSPAGLGAFVLIAVCGMSGFVGFGMLTVSATVMLADITDYHEWKFKERSDGIIISMQPFLSKVSGAVAALITGIGLVFITGAFVIDAEHNIDEIIYAMPSYGILLLRLLMFAVPLVLVTVSFFLYRSKYKIVGEYKDQMVAELQNLRQAEGVEPRDPE